jgi:hypothetical protein
MHARPKLCFIPNITSTYILLLGKSELVVMNILELVDAISPKLINF